MSRETKALLRLWNTCLRKKRVFTEAVLRRSLPFDSVPLEDYEQGAASDALFTCLAKDDADPAARCEVWLIDFRPSRQDSAGTGRQREAEVVHDLRNPLGAIYAAAEMLLELDAGPTQVKRLATNIYRGAGRMRELLADLNSVARGNRPMAEICDIGEVIAAASDAASATTKNHNVQILLEVSEGIELPLIRSRMERVFFNLIANALGAVPTRGKLHIVCRKANYYVLIELEDTGPGIPRGIRDRLFEPFVTAGKQDGLGLGLAISRQTFGLSPPPALVLLSAFP
jgi:nitrogen-specific signal transduction histidine kinase